MKKKTFFGNWEVICILINLICTKIFLNYPRMAAEQGGTAGWLFSIYISILALIAFTIIQKLYKPFEGKDILDIGEHVAGGVGRIAIGMVIIFFLGWFVVVYLRTFSENMKLVALTNSPLSFVELFFIVCMITGAYFGIEAISRFHAIAIPFVTIGFFLLMLGVAPYYDLSNLSPLLGDGLEKIVVQGAPKVSVFSEILVLLLLAPFIKSHKNFKTTGYWGIGISSLFLLISALVYLNVFSYPAGLERVIPTFHIARLINLGRFFQRVESVFVIIWALASLLLVVISFYFILHVFQKAFKLDHYKPLIIPFAVLIMCLTFLPPNLVEAIRLEVDEFRNWSWLIAFVMPIFVLILARMKKKKAPWGSRN